MPVYPVGEVKSPVHAQRSQVVRRDRLCFPCTLEHEQLREDSDCLQPDRKWPGNFRKGELVVEEQGKEQAGSEDIFDFEGVNGWIMRWSETLLDGLVGWLGK